MALLVCSQKFVVKDLELIRNLSGHFGRVHLLQAGGRVINSTGRSNMGLEGVLITSWNSDLI